MATGRVPRPSKVDTVNLACLAFTATKAAAGIGRADKKTAEHGAPIALERRDPVKQRSCDRFSRPSGCGGGRIGICRFVKPRRRSENPAYRSGVARQVRAIEFYGAAAENLLVALDKCSTADPGKPANQHFVVRPIYFHQAAVLAAKAIPAAVGDSVLRDHTHRVGTSAEPYQRKPKRETAQ